MNDIIEELGSRLQAIPDIVTRNAIAYATLGPRGRELVEIINQATLKGETLKEALQGIANSGDIISQSQIDNLQKVKTQFDDFARDVKGQWLGIKEFIANNTLEYFHIQDVLPKGNLQDQALQAKAIAELRQKTTAVTPGTYAFLGNDADRAKLEEHIKSVFLMLAREGHSEY